MRSFVRVFAAAAASMALCFNVSAIEIEPIEPAAECGIFDILASVNHGFKPLPEAKRRAAVAFLNGRNFGLDPATQIAVVEAKEGAALFLDAPYDCGSRIKLDGGSYRDLIAAISERGA